MNKIQIDERIYYRKDHRPNMIDFFMLRKTPWNIFAFFSPPNKLILNNNAANFCAISLSIAHNRSEWRFKWKFDDRREFTDIFPPHFFLSKYNNSFFKPIFWFLYCISVHFHVFSFPINCINTKLASTSTKLNRFNNEPKQWICCDDHLPTTI